MSFLGVLGGIAKTVGAVAVGAATGGLPGAIIGGVTAAAGSSGGGVRSAAVLPSTGMAVRLPTVMPTGVRGFAAGPGGGMPAFSPFPLSTSAGQPSALTTLMTACPRGFHQGKHKTLLHPFGGCVKNRRMNVANVRALRRSIRRLSGFEKLARRVLRITSPRKAHVISGFKRRTRKR